jgi:hypothetical protein
MKKEVLADFHGHSIRVVNTWFSGMKLYIDGDVRDEHRGMFSVSGDSPALSASLSHGDEKHRVEVFVKALFTVKIKICVDGRHIGGESF